MFQLSFFFTLGFTINSSPGYNRVKFKEMVSVQVAPLVGGILDAVL